MEDMSVRRKQCKACPWKKSTVPERDIPNGYCEQKHANLKRTMAQGLEGFSGPLRIFACHESPPNKEQPCVGWVIHQLGRGNNIALRMLALDGRFKGLELDGPQHTTFEATLPKKRRKRRS